MFSFPVVTCPEPNVANAIWSGSDRIYQAVVNVTCEDGYLVVVDGVSTVSVECQANGTWTHNLLTMCKR